MFLTVVVAVAASAVLGISGYVKSRPKYAGKEGI
jgi:archaellin